MASLTYGQLLGKNRSFRLLWSGQVISELGNWFNFVAGLGLLRVISGADPTVAGILMFTRTLPFAVVAPFAGALVDRFSRWQVLFWSDILRAVVALGFLFVQTPEDFWIAYLCSVLLSTLTAFFEAAKNASLPNITGDDGLLPGTALMFSLRFLLMSVGAALGGVASAAFGYHIAFLINSISFILSAYTIWLIPANKLSADTHFNEFLELPEGYKKKKNVTSFFEDFREGWKFAWQHPFVLTVILTNILWAIGGGAVNLIADRLGGVYFAPKIGWNPDLAVSAIYFATGAGLFLGMMVARRVGDYVFEKNISTPFIGWTLLLHGILFAFAGLTDNFALVLLLYFASRFLLGVEYAVQETLLMRAIPDYVRGRVMTIDRAAEISVFSLVAYGSGIAMQTVTPQTWIIITALISGSAGLLWFWRMRNFRHKTA